MVFFRKNKRHFVYRSQRRVFVALFLFAVFGATAVSFILEANAETTPVASIDFYSQESSFDNVDPGAWRVTKTAKWTGAGKAQITFDVVSRNKPVTHAKDVIMVVDTSSSMRGMKLDQLKHDSKELADDLLDESDNKIALIEFNDYAVLHTDLTDRAQTIKSEIEELSAAGCTSYYAALLKVENLLDNYTFQDNRDVVVLFLTDGAPCVDVPNEIGVYRSIKAKYPSVVINGVQYEAGQDEVVQDLINVSDNQFLATAGTLRNVLMESVKIPVSYDNFTLTDFIDDDYWTISGTNAISTPNGTTSLSYDGETPKIVWDLSGSYLLGSAARMTIDIELKSAYLNATDLLLPTNKQTVITSTLKDIPDENVSSNATPQLKDVFNVSYEANKPATCDLSGSVPEAQNYSIYSSVEISSNELTCDGYAFKGWVIATTNTRRINDDYFMMPANDVVLKATWSKLSISKTMAGEINSRATATFDIGPTVNTKMRLLSGEAVTDPYSYDTYNQTITNIARSASLSSTVDINDDKYILSDPDSPVKIYGWFDNGTLYFYTDADDIYLNEDASIMFFSLSELTNINALRAFDVSRTKDMSGMLSSPKILYSDINALRDWDMSNVENISGMFSTVTSNLTNLNGLKDWDVSSVINMNGVFAGDYRLQDLKPFENWDTSSVLYMANTFSKARNLTSLEGVENWDTGNVITMSALFSASVDNLTSLAPLEDWDTKNVQDMSWMFYSQSGWDDDGAGGSFGFTNVNDLHKWDVRKVTDMSGMFGGVTNLTNIEGISGWKTNSLQNVESLFDLTHVSSIGTKVLVSEPGEEEEYDYVGGLSDWDMSHVTTISYMFWGDNSLTNIDGASKWDTSNVELMQSTFSNNTSLADISGAYNWDTSKVKNINYTFYNTPALTNTAPLVQWHTEAVETAICTFAYSGITNLSGMVNWHFDSLTNSECMFYGATQLNDVTDAADWGMANVESVAYMFDGTTSLTSLDGLDGWTTSSLKNTEWAFANSGITSIGTRGAMIDEETQDFEVTGGLSTWDMSHVTSAAYMFHFATKLKNIDGARHWNTGSLTDMQWMFNEANKLENVDGARGWDVSHVTNMGWLFDANYALKSIEPLSDWVTSSVTDMQHIFCSNSALESLHGLERWDTTNVTTLTSSFKGHKKYDDLTPIANWNVKNVQYMNYIFQRSNIKSVDALAGWETDSLKSLSIAFQYTPYLTDISGLANWNVSNVTIFTGAFDNSVFADVDDLADWNVRNGQSFQEMFANNPNLQNVNGLANWKDKLTKVTTTASMFAGDTALSNINGLSEWNTPALTDMSGMFKDNTSLTNISALTNWNVAKLKKLDNAFNGDAAITSLAPLDDWTMPAFQSATDAFAGIPDEVARPRWYNE